VSAFGTNGYGYDANGNQTSRNLTSGNYTLTYDAENHMVGVSAVLAPTATPTSTMTSSPTVTGTASPTASSTNTATVTQTASSTATQTATVPTATATATVPTATASNTALPSATATATLAPSATNTPLPSPTATNTLTGSETATATTDPNQPTATQTASLTATQVPPTNTPAATFTASVSPTASLTYTASVSPTVTNTVTATMTLTPSNTTTSSPTASPTGPTPTPTATTIPTETTPEPLQSAKYVYDGDGNMVKAIVNSTLGNTTTTYYPGRHYNVEVKNGTQKVQKYYSAGSTVIAVRTVVNGTDTLQWMVSDQIGSTSVTANADGTWNSEIRYTAFGEIRWKNGVTPTNYRFTGQLDMQTSIGLDYYVARYYDPSITHFIQPDSLIPNAGSAKSFDHYAYALNNPIMFNDPTGHDVGGAFLMQQNYSEAQVLEYSGYKFSNDFVGTTLSSPVKQFKENFIQGGLVSNWWRQPLHPFQGLMICGLVAGNGINGKTWNDVGNSAINHGFTNSSGMQPSQATATYKDTFGANKVAVSNNITPKDIYNALKTNKAVILDMMVTTGNGNKYTWSTKGGTENTSSHFARIVGMDWEHQYVYVQNTLPGVDTWEISVDELKQSMTNPEVNTNAKNAETVDSWGAMIDQGK
jgi:RHS repeat-associated protein